MDKINEILGISEIAELDLSTPQSWTFVIMLFTAMLYGGLLNLIYTLYYKESEPHDSSLARSLILLTPSLMTIFWVVQYSLHLSVGLLGALSFVRFRSPIKRAEDIAFIVICLACAISCAIIKPLLGLGLITLFLFYAFIRNYFSPESFANHSFAVLTYNTKNNVKINELENILLQANCKNYEFISSRTFDGITSFVFNIPTLKKSGLALITEKLEEKDKNSSINVFYPNGRLGA